MCVCVCVRDAQRVPHTTPRHDASWQHKRARAATALLLLLLLLRPGQTLHELLLHCRWSLLVAALPLCAARRAQHAAAAAAVARCSLRAARAMLITVLTCVWGLHSSSRCRTRTPCPPAACAGNAPAAGVCCWCAGASRVWPPRQLLPCCPCCSAPGLSQQLTRARPGMWDAFTTACGPSNPPPSRPSTPTPCHRLLGGPRTH
jgi:hypothetical protein